MENKNTENSKNLKTKIIMLVVGAVLGAAAGFPAGYSAGQKSGNGNFDDDIYAAVVDDAKNTGGEAVKYLDFQTVKSSAETEDTNGLGSGYQKKNTYFTVSDVNNENKDIDLADYKGKPVLIMMFTAHCPFCRKEAPVIKEIYDKYNSKGLQVLAIDSENDKAGALKFAKEYKFEFPIGYDGEAVAWKYSARGVPYMFLLDETHNLMRIWAGVTEYGTISKNIEKILK